MSNKLDIITRLNNVPKTVFPLFLWHSGHPKRMRINAHNKPRHLIYINHKATTAWSPSYPNAKTMLHFYSRLSFYCWSCCWFSWLYMGTLHHIVILTTRLLFGRVYGNSVVALVWVAPTFCGPGESIRIGFYCAVPSYCGVVRQLHEPNTTSETHHIYGIEKTRRNHTHPSWSGAALGLETAQYAARKVPHLLLFMCFIFPMLHEKVNVFDCAEATEMERTPASHGRCLYGMGRNYGDSTYIKTEQNWRVRNSVRKHVL